MLRRLWTSVQRDNLINLRNHYLTVVVLAALIYLVFAKLVVPADLAVKPEVYLVDRTEGARFATRVEQQLQAGNAAEKAYLLGSPEELRQRMEGNQNSVGVVLEEGSPLPRVTLYFQPHHNEKVRNLLAVSMEGELRQLYGEPWPQEVAVQQQFLRPQQSAASIPFNQILVPILLISDAAMIGLLFIAALIFMEKEEGTLMAYLVTPGRVFEYLLSKTLTLALLAVVFTLILVPPMLGWRPNYLHLLAVMVMASIFTSLLGAWIALYFENLNQALFPLVGLIIVMGLPWVAYLVPSFSPLWLQWIPTYPVAFALREAVFPAGNPEVVYRTLALLAAMSLGLLTIGSLTFKGQVARA